MYSVDSIERQPIMPDTFAELYAPLLKNDVFMIQARENLAQGADGLTCALACGSIQHAVPGNAQLSSIDQVGGQRH